MKDLDLIHASVAADVYARLALADDPPWEKRTKIDRAVDAADAFVREYQETVGRRRREMIAAFEAVNKIPLEGGEVLMTESLERAYAAMRAGETPLDKLLDPLPNESDSVPGGESIGAFVASQRDCYRCGEPGCVGCMAR